MIEIQSYVKRVKLNYYDMYQNGLNITVTMNDGRKAKFKTTGGMTLQKIVDKIIERLEK